MNKNNSKKISNYISHNLWLMIREGLIATLDNPKNLNINNKKLSRNIYHSYNNNFYKNN